MERAVQVVNMGNIGHTGPLLDPDKYVALPEQAVASGGHHNPRLQPVSEPEERLYGELCGRGVTRRFRPGSMLPATPAMDRQTLRGSPQANSSSQTCDLVIRARRGRIGPS